MKLLPLKPARLAVLWNLVLALLLFMAARICFYLLNQNLFAELSLLRLPHVLGYGVVFDLSALAYGNALWLLLMLLPAKFRTNSTYQSTCKALFVAFNSILLAANCMDFIYYRYTLRRTTSSIFKEFSNEQQLPRLIAGFAVEYWYVFLIWFAMIAALVLLYRRAKHVEIVLSLKNNILYYAANSLVLILTTGLCVIAMRGGVFNARPIAPAHALKYTPHPAEAAVILNTPFTMIRGGTDNLRYVNYFTDTAELNKFYNPLHTPSTKNGSFRRKNIVIIIWESMGKDLVGYFNRDLDGGTYRGYTPFVDSMLSHSLTFTHSYANGRHSNEAVPSICIGVHSIAGEPLVLSPYATNEFHGLPYLLKEKGYSSAFFHGCFNGSMHIDYCAKMAGFQDYYGKDEFGNDDYFDGGWGIYDEEFLQYTAMKISDMQQPFVVAVQTQSSHGPYKVPQKYDDKWRDCTQPFLRSMMYADYSVRKFFETASQQSWYDSTIFVIVADHATAWFDHSPDYDHYRTSVGQMSIPIIFYTPDGSMHGERSNPVQQTDIMPTILGMLNYDKPYLAFGQDAMLDSTMVINYINGFYQVFCGKYVLLSDGESMLGLYDIDSDKYLKINMLDPAPPPHATQTIADAMQRHLQAFLQQYYSRLQQNRVR